jgi:hypothetical protein
MAKTLPTPPAADSELPEFPDSEVLAAGKLLHPSGKRHRISGGHLVHENHKGQSVVTQRDTIVKRMAFGPPPGLDPADAATGQAEAEADEW